MKTTLTFFVSILIIFSAHSQEMGSLIIEIPEIKEQKGSLIILMYSSEEGFPRDHEKADFKARIDDFGEAVSHTFENVPFGTYAVLIMQDKNRNGKMDTKRLIPKPKEPIGMSNIESLSRPDFDKSSFEFDKESMNLVVTLMNQ